MKKIVGILALSLALVGCSNDSDSNGKTTEKEVKNNNTTEQTSETSKQEKKVETKEITFPLNNTEVTEKLTKTEGKDFDIWLFNGFELKGDTIVAEDIPEDEMYAKIEKINGTVDIKEMKRKSNEIIGRKNFPREVAVTGTYNVHKNPPLYVIRNFEGDDFHSSYLYEVNGVSYLVEDFHKERDIKLEKGASQIESDFISRLVSMIGTLEDK